MLINLGVSFVGVLVFIFIFWKRLKEDYSSELIFKSAFLILISISIFAVFGNWFLHAWSFFIETVGIFMGILVVTFRLKVRFFELLEAATVGFLPWLSLFFLTDSVLTKSSSSFLGFLLTLFIIFVFYYLDVHYKNFGWYKSGKIGFSGMVTIALVFLTRSLVAITGITVLSFVNRSSEILISGSIMTVCLFGVFWLGRQLK